LKQKLYKIIKRGHLTLIALNLLSIIYFIYRVDRPLFISIR